MNTLSSVVLIDEKLENLDQLIGHLSLDVRIVLLNDQETLMAQTVRALAALEGVEALHIITHGHPGEIVLGDQGLSLETLPIYGMELSAITAAMSHEGEIYLYGCEVAAGERGAAFVEMLSDITGLRVAAATHKVGHAELGGSWELDAAPAVMSGALTVSEWRGVLVTPIDGTYTFADAIDNNDGTYTTADGFFVISAVNGEYATADDDLVVADETGVYINSGGGPYTGSTNDPAGPASPTSYIEVKPAATGSFVLNSAVIGEISNDTAEDDSDYTNIYVVGYANGVEVARTATHSSVGTLDAEYNFQVDYFSPFSEKYIDTVRIYFDTPAADFVDRLTLINMDISGASTDAAPEIPTVNFNYTVGGDFSTVNSVNGMASETSLGNTTDVPYAGVLFSAGVNDAAFTAVYQIGGSSGISSFNTQTDGKLEYLAVTSYDAVMSLRQFKVYNDSGNDITLTITGHASINVYDSGLATNSPLNTTTAVAVAGEWTTVDLPADFGEYAGFRIDSGSGTGTVPLYFNGFAIETTPPPPAAIDLNGADGDGNDFAIMISDSPVALADTDADISGVTSLLAYVDLTQIKIGDKLILGDPANGGVTIELDNITGTIQTTFGTSTITAVNDRNFDFLIGDGDYIFVQIDVSDADTLTTLMKTDMKFSGSEAGDRVFNFLDGEKNLLATSTVTIGVAASNLSGVTTSHTFTETELQTAPQLLDDNVTFNYDNAKLTKIDGDHYATLYVNYVDIDPTGNGQYYDAVNQTYYDPANPGTYTNFQLANNPLSLNSNGLLQFNNSESDGEVLYDGQVIGYLESSSDGIEIKFNEAANPTAAAIDKIIESITLSVNDYPTEQSKIRIVLEDNTGATTDPVYVDVNVTAENDAPVLSSAVGIKMVNMLSDEYEYAYSVQTLQDGSIIVAGVAFGDPDPEDDTEISNFTVLTKYAADGTLDTTFGTNGVVTIAPAEEFDNPQIAIDSTGKIVVTSIHGYTDSNINHWDTVKSIGVMRYNANGTLDTSFASDTNNIATYRSDGIVNLNGNPKIALFSDNSIAVTYPYHTEDWSPTDFAVVKFTNTGSVDSTFGTSGIKLIDMANSSFDDVSNIKVDANGNIVLVGTVKDAQTNVESAGLAIIDAQGNVTKTITSANNDVWSAIAENVSADVVAIQSDGKIVAAGSADWNGLILARYSSTGELDANFGTDGKVALSEMYSAQDIAIHEGKIYVLSADENMTVIRLNSDGTTDNTFGVDGVATITSGDEPWGAALKIAADGTVWIVGGDSTDDNKFNIAKLSADGIPDAAFGDKATYTTYGDPIVLDGAISVFDGELSDYENDDYYFNGATLTIARQGGADTLDIFSAAADSDLSFVAQGNIVEYNGDEVGTFTNTGGQLSITFNDYYTESYIVNGVMRSIAYQYGDDTVAQPTDINLVWTFNDGNTGAQGRTVQGTGAAQSTTLVQTLNIAIGEPEPVSSVTLNVNNPFTTNDPNDTTAITIDAPEGINITNASNSAVTGLPKNVKMPLGQFGFTLSGLDVGETVQMSMTADADFKQFTYFKKSLVTNKWVNIVEGVTINQDGTATVKFSLTDGGEFDADHTANGVIVDPGGVGENVLLPMIAENTSEVGNISLLDETLVSGSLSYAITGGADADKFTVNASTGLLSFNDAPNYEEPTDAGDTTANNTYAVQVTVTGSTSGTEVQNLIVSVLNVAEEGDNPNTAPVIVGIRAEAQAVTVGSTVALDDIRVADVNSDTMTVTLSALNGTLGGLIDTNLEEDGIQLTGTAADINEALANATFTATAAGAAGVSISIVDIIGEEQNGSPITTTAYYSITASAAQSGGSSSGGTSTPLTPPSTTIINEDHLTAVVKTTPITETVGNTTVMTQTATATRTFTDANGESVTQTNKVVEAVQITAPTGSTTTTSVPLYWGESSKTAAATTASVSAGVTLASEGNRAPTTTQTKATAIDDLIYYIQTTVPSTDGTKSNMLGGGSSFLTHLNNVDTLVVNKVVLSTTSASSTAPATVSLDGTATAVTTNGVTQTPTEALVIDGTSLSSGSTVSLSNIEFGVLTGSNLNVVMTGSATQTVYTGSGTQTLNTGSSTHNHLYAGAGNDHFHITVPSANSLSAPRAEAINSLSTSDTFAGSIANKTALYGEDGNDITTVDGAGTQNVFVHGGSGADSISYQGSINDYTITRDNGITYVHSNSTSKTDILLNVESIQFADGTYAIANNNDLTQIASLYQQVLGRQADVDGFQYWASIFDNGDTIGAIATSFVRSSEYFNNTSNVWDAMSNEQKIETFYQLMLGRASDAAGKAYWMDAINNGMSIEDIAGSFVVSAEMQGICPASQEWNFTV